MSNLRFSVGLAILTTTLAGAVISTPAHAATPANACFTMSGSTITAYTVGGASSCPTNVDIPATVGVVPVTAIGSSAFAGKTLTAVTIPSSVTSIGASAFTNNSLTTVAIPNTVTMLGAGALSFNSTLASATIGSGITALPDSLFSNSGLTSFTIPSTITSIGNYAFDSTKLASITLPNSVTTLGVGAFLANGLTSLTLGTGLTSIPPLAFTLNSLQQVTIPSSVTAIDSTAFSMQVDEPVAYWYAASSLDTATAAAQYATMHYTQLFTADPSNPAGLTDAAYVADESTYGGADANGNGTGGSDTGVALGGHIINPASITTHYVDATGATLSPSLTAIGTGVTTYKVADNPTSNMSLYYHAADTQVLSAPAIAGYSVITPASPYSMTLPGLQNTVTFVYSNPTATTTTTDSSMVLAEAGQSLSTLVVMALTGLGIGSAVLFARRAV